MKLSFLFAVLILSTLSIQSSYAGGGLTGGATLPMQIVQESTSVIAKGSTVTNAIANGKSTILSYVLKPIGDGLIQIAQEQISRNLISWIGGGFEGNPLIIGNPAKYIQQAGLSEVKIALGNIPTEGVFADSIFNSVIRSYKGTSDLASQLKALSTSELPAMIQGKVCADAYLTALAIQDVKSTGKASNQAAITAAKNKISTYACQGNPATDAKVASRLLDFSKQRPSLLGAEEILYLTQNNEFTASIAAQRLIAQKVGDRQELEKLDIFGGAAPTSQKKCVKYAPTYAVGQIPECQEFQTLNPGELIQGAAQKALSGPLDRLSSLTANGFTDAAIAKLLTAFALQAITKGLSNAISSAGGGPVDNTPIVLTARTTPINDLVNDESRKKQYVKITTDQFVGQKDTLDRLRILDIKYSNAITTYEGAILSGKTCYDDLVKNNKLPANDGQVRSALDFYQSRLAIVTPKKNRINEELSKISEAIAYIDETAFKIASSNSSEEIGNFSILYTETVDKRGYPTATSLAEREGEYLKDSYDAEHDDALVQYQKTCEQLSN